MSITDDKLNELMARFAKARHSAGEERDGSPAAGVTASLSASVQKASFAELPAYRRLVMQKKVAAATGILQPFFVTHEGKAAAKTVIGGRDYLNFSTYDYLGLNGDPRIIEAAVKAMQRYGTSAGASRLVAGQRPIHEEFEKALAAHYGTEAALSFVSGFATNVSVISTVMGREDVIFEDSLCHNSIVTGALDSRAQRVVYPHNDMAALRDLLALHRPRARRALIVTEGVFSMDGNYARLKDLIALKKEFAAFLMVDEAHALGTAGKSGRGSFEAAGVDPLDVDIWMGTLSKTLCTCGGYIAGCHELIELLKYTAGAFVYSVGLSPVLAAASLKALELLERETFRTEKLQENARLALSLAHKLKLNTGLAEGTAIIPILVGSSLKAAFLSNLLMEHGICALPIIHPVVPEGEARLRLFLSSSHSAEDIGEGLKAIADLLPEAERREHAFSSRREMEARGER